MTIPYLQSEEGVISQSKAIGIYIAEKYNPELLGKNLIEKSLIFQWIDFVTLYINECSKAIINPIFGWSNLNNENNKKSFDKLKEYLIILDNHLKGKKYFVGNKLSLADIIIFRFLRLIMSTVCDEKMRNSYLKNLTKWFRNIMESEEALNVYGRTILCKTPLKPFIENEIDENENKDKYLNNKKNPLDNLPQSDFDLKEFKNIFINSNDKEEELETFYEELDEEGYSLWYMEYDNLPNECKVLYKSCNFKNFFLQKLENFRKYSFAVFGVYGKKDNYKIKGVWLWKGKNIPDEIKENDNYDYLIIKKLILEKPNDRKLIHDFWIKIKKGEVVDGTKVVETGYFY